MFSALQVEMLAQINIQERLAEADQYRLGRRLSGPPRSLRARLANWLGGALASGVNDVERRVLPGDGIQPPRPSASRQG